MGLIESGLDVAKALVPPKTNDLEEQQRWRWVVFAAIMVLATSFTAHVALECGWVPSVFSGFASASDQQAIQRRIDVIASLSLEHEMRDKALQLCSERDQQKRNELNDEISKLQREYYDISHNWYTIPRCDQL